MVNESRESLINIVVKRNLAVIADFLLGILFSYWQGIKLVVVICLMWIILNSYTITLSFNLAAAFSSASITFCLS